MTCAACSNRIEKKIEYRVEGVHKAAVNLAVETTVEYDVNRVSPETVDRVIRDTGYDVVLDKVELRLKGMTCAACAARLEKALNKAGRVVKAAVQLCYRKRHGGVQRIPSNGGDMIKAVQKGRYDAEEKTREDEDIEKRARKGAKTAGGLLSCRRFFPSAGCGNGVSSYWKSHRNTS